MSRVVGGRAGGRRLITPRGRATRPSAERTREGLFSTLEAMRGGLIETAFLDLYAGSGAVGLEAASRGAARVLLVERDPRALAALRVNVASLALPGVTVRTGAVETVLATAPEDGFDVVFLDPPYDLDVRRPLELLVDHGWLASPGIVVVERASRDGEPPWPRGIVRDRSRRYGDSTLWYGRRP